MNVNLPSKTKAPIRDIIIEDHILSNEDKTQNDFLKAQLKQAFREWIDELEQERRIQGDYYENGVAWRNRKEKDQRLVFLNSTNKRLREGTMIKQK